MQKIDKEIEGGLVAVQRLQNAYGFSRRKDFAEYLQISPNTFGTWGSRNFFPSDLAIKCQLETGARIEYLCFGEEPIFNEISDMKFFHRIRLENGKVFKLPPTAFMLPHLPEGTNPDTTLCAVEENKTYFINTQYGDLVDGDYFVTVENSHLIRYLTILPGGKVRVDGGKFSFEANVSDIEIVGKVILKMEKE